MAENVGFNIELGLDSSGLREGLNQVKNDLKSGKEQLKEIDKQLKIAPDNIDTWKRKQQLLNKQIDDTKKKLKLQTAQLKKAQTEFDNTDDARKNISKLKKEISNTTNELKKMEAQSTTVNAKLRSLTSLNVSKLSNIGTTITKNITAPAIAAATALGALAVKTALSAHNISDSAKQVGANTQSYQELSYAAKILGADSESLYRAFRTVNDMMGDIATGNSLEVAQNLSKIGLSIEDIKGLDSAEAFMVIRDALSEVEDESLQVALANEIFGDKIGATLLPLLKAEKDQIEELKDEANELGIATDDQVAKADEFAAAQTKLKQALYGVALTIMDELLPNLTDMINYIEDKVIPKIKDVIEWWKNLDGNIKIIIESLGIFLVALGPILTTITKVITTVSTLSKGFTALSTALGGMSAVSLGTVAGIAALIAIIVYAYNTNEDFRNSINEIISSLGELLGVILSAATDLLQSLMPAVTALTQTFNVLLDALMPLIQIYLEALNKYIKGLTEKFKTFFEFLKPFINLVVDFIVRYVSKLGEWIAPIIGWITKLVSALKDKLEPIITKIKDIINEVVDKLKFIPDTIKKVGESAKNIGSGIFDSVGGFFSNIGSSISNTVSGIFGGGKSISNQAFTTNNSVNVYTSSATYDINSINAALGGSYR